MSHATEAPTKVCAVCGKPIRRDRFMCLAHWRQVPMPMQIAVWRSYRAFLNRRTPQQGKQALAEYRAATDSATSYVAAMSNPSTTPQEPFQ